MSSSNIFRVKPSIKNRRVIRTGTLHKLYIRKGVLHMLAGGAWWGAPIDANELSALEAFALLANSKTERAVVMGIEPEGDADPMALLLQHGPNVVRFCPIVEAVMEDGSKEFAFVERYSQAVRPKGERSKEKIFSEE